MCLLDLRGGEERGLQRVDNRRASAQIRYCNQWIPPEVEDIIDVENQYLIMSCDENSMQICVIPAERISGWSARSLHQAGIPDPA